MTQQLKGFLPDLDPTTPGILTACVNVAPSPRGLRSSKTLVATDITGSLDGLPLAASLLKLNDGSTRVFVASDTKAAEVLAGAYTTRFTHDTTATAVSFAAMGNISLMANGVDKVCSAAPTADFSEITDAPVTSLLVSASGFVMALGHAGAPDGWWCSGLFDYTKWVPDQSTQAANGTLYQTPGAITAGVQLNDDVIAFKRGATYRGRYVGTPNIWEWDVLSSNVGCIGPNALCATPAGIVFIGADDIYLLSGSGIQPLGAGVRLWLFSSLNRAYEAKVYAQYDEAERLVYIGFPGNEGGTVVVNSVLVYDLATQMFGRLTNAGMPLGVYATVAVQYSKGAVTIDGLDDLYTSIDSISEAPDSPLWANNQSVASVLGSDGLLYTLTGPSAEASLTLFVFGDPSQFTRLTKVTPQWLTPPTGTTNSAALFASNDHVANLVQTKTAALFSRSFNFVKSARWFQVKFTFTGTWELININYQVTAEGIR